ncbi:O-antigen/teichoic acid export membrane protein [Curtobacterium pusillum]|uniref:O-antigen/teichoic acid export membrane protein n=1 Tax=Curtobacterium pusillum TaxID=69373 RepID=A0AAW3T654_9MICO|nr:oligosaccharide flippase family protein [Curtobacterium pusillum]MBA8989718.1 O-antigen/teichoic acid export membrane protein [Curtobacterium pusillum]
MSGARHNRAANILAALVGNAFPPLASIATAPILAQALGVDGRGAVAAATAPLFLATALATFGVPAAVTRTLARHPWVSAGLAGRAVAILSGAGLVVTAALVATAPFFGAGNVVVVPLVVLASAMLVPTLLVALLQAVAAGRHRWRLVTIERAVTAGTRLVVLAALASADALDVTLAVAVLAVSPVLGAIAYLGLLRGARAEKPVGSETPRTRALVSFGARVWFGSVAGVLLTRLDQALITPLSGAAELGLYVVAVNVADIPLVISNAVRDVSFAADAAEADDRRMLVASRISSALTVVVSGALAATAWWWVPMVFGAEFIAAMPACLVLLLATAVGGQGALAGVTLSARGAPGRRSVSLVVAAVVNTTLLVLLVPTLGAVGAAIGTLVGCFVSSSLNVLQVWRRHGIDPRSFYGLRATDVQVCVRALRRLRSRSAM